MVQIDDVSVNVADRRVPVRMAVRLRPFPALMRVPVVFVVHVQVLVALRGVAVRQCRRIGGRP